MRHVAIGSILVHSFLLLLAGLSRVVSFQVIRPWSSAWSTKSRFNNILSFDDVARSKTVLLREKTGGDEKKGVDIDEVSKEVSEALDAANKALAESKGGVQEPIPPPQKPTPPPPESKTTKPVTPPPKPSVKVVKGPPPPQPPKLDPLAQKKQAELQTQALAATLGGAVVGGTLGAGLLLGTDLPDALGLRGQDILAIPLASAVFLSGTAAATAGQDSVVGSVSRTLFAKPVVGFGESIVGGVRRSLRNAFQWVVGFPGRVTNALKQKAQDTAEEIVAFPGKAATKVKEEIEAIPTKVKEEIEAIPDKVIDAAESTAKKVETDIKAIPSNVAKAAERTAEAVADATTKSVQKAGQAVEDTVEDIIAIPGKAVKAVGDKVEDVVEDIAAIPKDITSNLKGTFEKEAPPKTQTPPTPPARFEIPKVEVPKVEVPKVELPKMQLPKVEPIKFPKLPKPEAKEAPRIRAAPPKASEADKQKAARINAQLKKEKELKEQKLAKADQEARLAAEKAKQEAAATAKADAESKKQAAARAKQEAADARKAQMEAKAAAVAKRAEAAAQKAIKDANAVQKQREEKRRKAEEAKRTAAAREMRKAEEAKAVREAAAAEKQRKAEEAKAAREAAVAEKQRQAEEKRKAAVVAKQSKKKAAKPPPPKRPAATRAPRGVPTVVKWRQRRDGGITGVIYGSPNFDEGDRVETTEIVSGKVENGSVVKTGSGSRYFLSDTVPGASVDKGALKTLLAAIPGATITLTKEAKERDARMAEESLEAADRPTSRTFSVFGFGGDRGEPKAEKKPAEVVKPVKKAPPGVPTLTKWRKNRDGSVNGLIFGSKNFSEGERITTSPIAGGDIESGKVVRTGSGSRYFLD